jgi:lactoylglutathione lyase
MSAFPTVSTFGHVGLNVSDLNRSKQFYQQIFGFQILRESQENNAPFALLGEGGQVVLTLWQQSSGQFPKHLPGLHHLAFRVDSMDDVRQVEQRLQELKVHQIYNGIVPHSEGSQSGGIFFEDPDGIRLEVFSPTGAEACEAPSHGPSCGFF